MKKVTLSIILLLVTSSITPIATASSDSILNVRLNKTEARPGEALIVTTDITSLSGINWVNLILHPPSGGTQSFKTYFKLVSGTQQNGTWSMNFVLSPTAESGIWKLVVGMQTKERLAKISYGPSIKVSTEAEDLAAKAAAEKLAAEKLAAEKLAAEKLAAEQEASQKRKDDAEAAAVAKAIAKRKAELQYQADAPARAAADAQAKVQAQIKIEEQAKAQAKAEAQAEAEKAQAKAEAEIALANDPTTISDPSDPVSGQMFVMKNKKDFTIKIETSRASEVFKIVGKKKNHFAVTIIIKTDKEGNARVKKGLSLSGYKLTLIHSDTSAVVDSYQVK